MPPEPPGPHHKPPQHPGPPPHHGKEKKSRPKRIAISVISGTVVALATGLALHFSGISVNVILPVLAPIWVGVTTIAFTELSH